MRKKVMDGIAPHMDGIAPYFAPNFDFRLRDRGVFQRFWIAENGFANGRSFQTIEEAREDAKLRTRVGIECHIYDDRRHEWVCCIR
jgi:hypothetical protein